MATPLPFRREQVKSALRRITARDLVRAVCFGLIVKLLFTNP
jgi:hypothetical protein